MNEQLMPERAPSPVETPALEVSVSPSGPTTPTPDLPPTAADADDLRVIKQAVGDAASVGGAQWFTYLGVLFYLAIAAGAVTHADLFFENRVKLPFLGVELSLFAFFVIAPILVLVVHAYALVHLVMLTDKVKRFHHALHEQIGERTYLPKEESKSRQAIRDALRRQLPSNIFVRFLAGPAPLDLRDKFFCRLLEAIGWVTLVVLPVFVLLLMQVQFLPYHSRPVTWTHRVAVALDLGLVSSLWSKVLSGREADDFPRPLGSWPAFTFVVGAFAFLFSWTLATFPGEWLEDFLARFDKTGLVISFHDSAFNSAVDETTRHRFPFSSTLVLTGLNIYEGLKIDDPKKAEWQEFVFRVRGRDLKGAIFDFATLPKVDFEGSQLQGASLNFARLEDASFVDTRLQGASLGFAQLQGASFNAARLEGAILTGAQLQGAFLQAAELQGASLWEAQLQGASLDANLQGTDLSHARLQGASLSGALEATDLSKAHLWRTEGGAAAAIRLPDGSTQWLPSDDEDYRNLRKTMESLPPGPLRDDSLERILRLDCANPDPTLSSCDPSRPPTREAAAWRKSLEDARVDDTVYAKALAQVLRKFVCAGDDDAPYVVRGLTRSTFPAHSIRLAAAGSEAPALVDFIMSKDCPVSASLTDADKARLLWIKRDAIKRSGTPRRPRR
jgi:uncharacterized protein YjbI with pentapeptide repeats